LVRGRDRRSDPNQALPGARTLVSVLQFYDPRPFGDGVVSPKYARYLRGVGETADYHVAITETLEHAMASAKARWRERGESDFSYKVCVDTSAVLERTWANIAGLGWIGRNTLLIHTQRGSYSFIGTVLIDRAIDELGDELGDEPGDGSGDASLDSAVSPRPRVHPAVNLCGSCTACVDACPTGALTGDLLSGTGLDARRCISYWTLEARGDLNLSPSDQNAVGTWVAGCDICQEVCPFNGKALKSAPFQFGERQTSPPTWEEHLQEGHEQYRIRAKVSALSRIKPLDFARNLSVTIQNRLKS
jgi:epoxyqueuosine reductase